MKGFFLALLIIGSSVTLGCGQTGAQEQGEPCPLVDLAESLRCDGENTDAYCLTDGRENGSELVYGHGLFICDSPTSGPVWIETTDCCYNSPMSQGMEPNAMFNLNAECGEIKSIRYPGQPGGLPL